MQKIKSLKVIILTVVLIMAFANVAFAGIHNFFLVNHTGYPIIRLHISHSGTNSWEEDVLGNEILYNDQVINVNLNGGKTKYWDIQAVFQDGSALSWYDAELMTANRVTLDADGNAIVE